MCASEKATGDKVCYVYGGAGGSKQGCADKRARLAEAGGIGSGSNVALQQPELMKAAAVKASVRRQAAYSKVALRQAAAALQVRGSSVQAARTPPPRVPPNVGRAFIRKRYRKRMGVEMEEWHPRGLAVAGSAPQRGNNRKA